MGQDDRLVKPEVVAVVTQLKKFAETCSNQSLGDLQLSRMNESANAEHDFQEQVQKLLQHVLKIVDMAESWAQKEAEARYVTFLRQHELLRREEQVIEAKKLVTKRRKLLVG